MSDADINWLLSDERSVIRHFPKGAFIFKELDRPGQVYVLLDGKVVIAKGTLSGKRILITRIEQSGEMFGEVYAFLGKACYPMYAEAAEDTSWIMISFSEKTSASHARCRRCAITCLRSLRTRRTG